MAALIRRQARDEDSPAQFITTTFRSELVEVADKCFGIQFQNKISRMVPMPKSEALEFIRQIIVDEGAADERQAASKALGKSHARASGHKRVRGSHVLVEEQ